MYKAIENIITLTENSIVDFLYRFADDFFDDTRSKKDLIDVSSVKFIISNSVNVYLAARRETEKWVPVLYEHALNLLQFVYNQAAKAFLKIRDKLSKEQDAIEFFPATNSGEDNYNKSFVSVRLEQFADWLFYIPKKNNEKAIRKTAGTRSVNYKSFSMGAKKLRILLNWFRFEYVIWPEIFKYFLSG